MLTSQQVAQRRRRAREAEEKAAMAAKAARLKAAVPLDYDIFEAIMFALLTSDYETDCWVPDAAAPFAALLTRIAEQVIAEFGPHAAEKAFLEIAASIAGAAPTPPKEPPDAE